MRVERIVLKHHCDVTFGWFHIVYNAVANRNCAGSDAFKACNHAQKRGLAAAGWTNENDEFTVLDLQRNAFDDFNTAAIALADIIKNDLAHYFSVSTRPLTNQRCISTTTRIGGMIARMAVTMT